MEPTHDQDELSAVRALTRVLIGDRDGVTVEHATAMARSVPDDQLAVVASASHAVMFERPDLVARPLLDFLAT